jgi:iron(III) transport system ATP-binding protein
MASIRIERLVKRFGDVEAVSDVNLEVAPGQVVGLLGPSGCGKTTILKCIAGLEEPSQGAIYIDDTLIASPGVSLRPEKRDIGMVFQSYALWPHKTVYANVSYPLEVRGVNREQIRPRVEAVLDMVGLGALGARFPGQLSGGQQQRVALARSLVYEPKILLFDEPLSNLDANTRLRVRGELKRLLRRVGITSVYVTHDQVEAMAICDLIVLMHRGRIVQVGPPDELYRNPKAPEVAELIGSGNFLDGVVRRAAGVDGLGEIDAQGLTLSIRLPHEADVGSIVRVLLRVESLELRACSSAEANCWKMQIVDQTSFGFYHEYIVSAGDAELVIHAAPGRGTVGDTRFVSIPAESVICFSIGDRDSLRDHD